MRKTTETLNFAMLLSLIEEAQTMANRMEGALGDQKDFEALKKRIREKKDELKKLEEKIERKSRKK
ncbi:MAG: hypothetical protein VYC70_08890 [Verrucomicrobiota bacterium]|nr:hypothetical protein [Verrucomicrobiota bacterium]